MNLSNPAAKTLNVLVHTRSDIANTTVAAVAGISVWEVSRGISELVRAGAITVTTDPRSIHPRHRVITLTYQGVELFAATRNGVRLLTAARMVGAK